jgi:UDPglucose 6-dehydrogenase
MPKFKVTIIGAGFVGMSLALLLSKKHNVSIFDIDERKVESINSKKTIINDPDIIKALKNKKLNLFATTKSEEALIDSNFVFIATPTNFIESSNLFDTTAVEDSIKASIEKSDPKSILIIKSTVPIGFTESQSLKYNTNRIIFSPEFLREGMALHDNLYPSRLIIGGTNNNLNILFANIMRDASIKKDFDILYMKSREAEAVKLFSNTFLAMRVAFFNELDSFAMEKNMSALNIVKGVSLDPRIGDYYNNPSFGYGGYCLPKDTKQLLSHYEDVPQSLIKAIIQSNLIRKDFLINKIRALKPKTIGIFRLVMKEGSDNFRESAILSLIPKLKESKIKILLYEPMLKDDTYEEIPVITNLKDFIDDSDMIIANRLSSDLINHENKVFTRDLFQSDI